MAKKRRAGLYLRLSQDRSGESIGIDRQQELCEKLVADRGWTVADTYTDRDRSAYSGQRRPEYDRLLADVRAGTVTALVAVDQDRIARRLSELAPLLDLLREHDVPIVTTSGDLDSTTSDGRLKLHILGSVAEHESGKKSERLLRQREQAARLGSYHGGRRPYGYEADGVTARKDEAKVIRDAVRRFLAGQSLLSIAARLNERRVPTANGCEWRVSTLRMLMTSPRLAGRRTFRGKDVGPAQWPSIVAYEDHLRVRRLIADPRIVKRGRPPSRLLSSFVKCGLCGGVMHVSPNGDRGPRYSCTKNPGMDNCGHLVVTADPLEKLVETAVLHAIDTAPVHAQMARKPKKRDDHEDIAALEADLAALAEDHGAGRITRAEWLAARELLAARLDAAQQAVEPVQTVADLRGIGDRWSALDIEGKRRIIGLVVDSVVVHPAVPGRRYFDSDRIDVKWRA
jgi:site-specific DNA recombinase